MLKLTVNGEAREVAEGTTVSALLRELGVHGTGFAVAVNARVVRGSAQDQQRLCEGDAVEIIRAVAGG